MGPGNYPVPIYIYIFIIYEISRGQIIQFSSHLCPLAVAKAECPLSYPDTKETLPKAGEAEAVTWGFVWEPGYVANVNMSIVWRFHDMLSLRCYMMIQKFYVYNI